MVLLKNCKSPSYHPTSQTRITQRPIGTQVLQAAKDLCFLRYHISPHVWAPEKALVRQPILILSPCWGPLRKQGLCSISAPLWAPEKVG